MPAPPMPRHSWLEVSGFLRVRVSTSPRLSLLGFEMWVCVFGFEFWLHPANPGLVVGLFLFVCALRLYPASPGRGVRCVCSGAGIICNPPILAGAHGGCVWVPFMVSPRQSWLGCWGVCVGVGAPPVPRQSWLGFMVRAHAFRFGLSPRHCWLGCWGVCANLCRLCLYPADPGWGVRCGCLCLGSVFGCAPPCLAGMLLCMRFCARSACTQPILACVLGFGCLCLGFGFHSTNAGWGVEVCVFVCALRLYVAIPSWVVWCGCVCVGWGFGCAPPFLAGVLGCVCLCAPSACAPPFLLGVCSVGVCVLVGDWAAPCLSWLGRCNVCVFVRTQPAPRQSWQGFTLAWFVFRFYFPPANTGLGVGVCVFVCAVRLYPAIPGWAVWCGCVCLFVRSACTPPILGGVCGGCLCVRF